MILITKCDKLRITPSHDCALRADCFGPMATRDIRKPFDDFGFITHYRAQRLPNTVVRNLSPEPFNSQSVTNGLDFPGLLCKISDFRHRSNSGFWPSVMQ